MITKGTRVIRRPYILSSIKEVLTCSFLLVHAVRLRIVCTSLSNGLYNISKHVITVRDAIILIVPFNDPIFRRLNGRHTPTKRSHVKHTINQADKNRDT